VPAPVDHAARRRDVSAAVWRVIERGGFGGLSLRAVAAEMGATTGLISHYFENRRALVEFALAEADERTRSLPRRTGAADELAGLRDMLLDVLPLDRRMTLMSRVWVSSWDAALADPELGDHQARRYRNWRRRLRAKIVAAQEAGLLDPARDPSHLAAIAAAFAHGLVVQALFDPASLRPARQRALVDEFLTGLTAPAATPA
jgi:AcrR family transcriptional regulator